MTQADREANALICADMMLEALDLWNVGRTRGGEAPLAIGGIVQGVGFRPFVYRLARRLELSGWVRNTPAGVDGRISVSC